MCTQGMQQNGMISIFCVYRFYSIQHLTEETDEMTKSVELAINLVLLLFNSPDVYEWYDKLTLDIEVEW